MQDRAAELGWLDGIVAASRLERTAHEDDLGGAEDQTEFADRVSDIDLRVVTRGAVL